MAKKTKAVAKPAEVKPAEVVAEPVVETAPAAVAAETVTEASAEVKAEKKTPAKKTAKVSEDKASVKKASSVKKEEPKKAESIEIQFGGTSFEPGDIIERCKAAYKGNSRKQIKTIAVYVNMDERKAYYVVNDKEEGAFITL